MATWYIGSTKYNAVAGWQASHAYTIGAIIRPAVLTVAEEERCYVCYKAGTSTATAPTFSTARAAILFIGTANFIEITGMAAMNGDSTNTALWTASKSTPVGSIVKNVTGTPVTYFVATTGGTTGGVEPAWDTTAGATTNDGTTVWKSLGPITNFTAWGAPHGRLNNAEDTGWGVNGDTFYISNNHNESSTTGTQLLIRGGMASPCKYICVDDSAAPPTATATTAQIKTASQDLYAGANNAVFYAYGINFTSGFGTIPGMPA